MPDVAETTFEVTEGRDKRCSIEITGGGALGALDAAARGRPGRPS